jgi:thioredoxin-related protein
MNFLVLLSLLAFTGTNWGHDLDKALQTAKESHECVLLTFSGSDWCGPCIRLHNEYFENEVFENYANTNLVMVNADFPRLKKNQLSKEQQQKNDAIADRYNKDGAFPLTVLINADGKVLKKWDGVPNGSVQEFTEELKMVADANKQ